METKKSGSRPAVYPMFKSYYVVWKLFGFLATNPKSAGLNRTMQYGNVKMLSRQNDVRYV